jgi:chromosomal replication initiator protein
VFHTFNDLHNANRQIVLTSDRPPRHLSLLEERLRSRFEWGLIADIEAPDLETRMAILTAKAEEHGEGVSPAVLECIAQRVTGNVRELEGCLNRVLAYGRLHQQPLTVELCRVALRDVASTRPPPEPSAVVEAVARYFRLDPAALRGPRRHKDLVLARHIAMYLLRVDCECSFPEIGKELGGRDHTTVIYGVDRINRERERDLAIDRTLNEVRNSLTGGNR